MITEVFKAMANGKVLEYSADEDVVDRISTCRVNSNVVVEITFRDGSHMEIFNPDYIIRSAT
jgi:hypothetical protein